jgi:phosphatidylserine/phosphatidylglycerophosphate/cardiolipin synthase-like enzyme
VVLAGARAGAVPPDRGGDRGVEAAGADRLPRADGGADPRGPDQALAEGVVDVAGVSDATQVAQVFGQWRGNENSQWKGPLLARVLSGLPWSGKVSTPYAPGAVHDYMHAKVTVADDVVFIGSFNLSRSGEENAENVLEIADGGLAERMAAFVDTVRARYPAIPVPPATS